MSKAATGDPNEPYTSRITEATDMIRLEDERTLAFYEFGDPTGPPVFVFHGGVGSRGFGLLFEAAAIDLGVRVIAPDRPGYGRSDPQPDRSLLHWPDDVSALADALALDAFGMLAVSGGGPWAAACAYALPDWLTALTLFSAMGRRGATFDRHPGHRPSRPQCTLAGGSANQATARARPIGSGRRRRGPGEGESQP